MSKVRHHIESPFPFQIGKGNGGRIVDERCRCGRLRSEHEDTFSYGHGAGVRGALPACAKFTWKAMVYSDGSER
jgi:hypothetical protein